MITDNMKELLQKVADLCYQASDEVIENEETKEILDTCDILAALIDKYFDGEAEAEGKISKFKNEWYNKGYDDGFSDALNNLELNDVIDFIKDFFRKGKRSCKKK